MPELTISLLGQPHVQIDGEPITFSRRKSLAMLAYIATTGETVRRDTLATLLWPEMTQSAARAALRREIHSLLNALDRTWLETDRSSVGLGPTDRILVDVHDFRRLIRGPTIEEWTQAAELYLGDFLTGFGISDSTEFDDWQFFEGEELHQQFAVLLPRIIETYASTAKHEQALPFARRWVTLDPLHEPAQRQLILAYALAGQQTAAMRQYERCEQVLADELGVPPSAETLELYEQISDGQIQPQVVAQAASQAITVTIPATQHQVDWGEAPDVADFCGRESETATLSRWLDQERCRLVAALGLGGIGKTALVTHVAGRLADSFDHVIWRSLRNAPPLDPILADWISSLDERHIADASSEVDQQISRLIELLAQKRCLLVLDNFESVLQAGEQTGQYRDGYAAYGDLLQRIGEGRHQSCLILTSREKPSVFAALEEDEGVVRSLPMPQLDADAGRSMLRGKGLSGTALDWQALTERYSGNPLALKLVAQTINEIFDGELGEFLDDETFIFGGVEALLDEQFERLTSMEQSILTWLAIEREPVEPAVLAGRFVRTPTRRQMLEALRSLRRRSLVERGETGFTLQNVVMEYVTERLVQTASQELISMTVESGSTLNEYGLMLAQAMAFVRESQRRLILQPLEDRLLAEFTPAELRTHLLAFIEKLRQTMAGQPGYAGGNLLDLVLQLRFDSAGLDLSELTVWQADLQGKTLTDARLVGADLSGSTFTDTIGNVVSVDISADGSLLAAADSTGNVRIWRLPDGQLVAICPGHTSWVLGICFSPDGRFLASVSDDGSARLWKARTGQALARLDGHDTGMFAVAFSPDGQLLATGGYDGAVNFWPINEIIDSTEIRDSEHGDLQIIGLDSAIKLNSTCYGAHANGLTWSPDGTLFVRGNASGDLLVWDVTSCLSDDSPDPMVAMPAHGGGIWALAFSPDGELIASGAEDHVVCLWRTADLRAGQAEPLIRLSDHTDWIRGVRFSPDGRLLVTASEDYTVRLWDVAALLASSREEMSSVHPLAVLTGHTGKVTGVSFTPDGQLLASSSDDQTIRLWQVTGPTITTTGSDPGHARFLHAIEGYSNRVWTAKFSPDGRTLASGHADGSIHFWEILAGTAAPTPRFSLFGHDSEVVSVRFSPDGQTLASGSWDGTIRLWDLVSGQLQHILRCQSGNLWDVVFGPDGKTLVSAGGDGLAYLWDVKSGLLQGTLAGSDGEIVTVEFNPVTGVLATKTLHRLHLWDIAAKRLIKEHEIAAGSNHYQCFSHDGRYLANVGQSGMIELWDADLEQRFWTKQDPGGAIWGIDFSHDGRMLATGGIDRNIRLWDVETGEQLALLEGHNNVVHKMSFSPHGRLLATSSDDETVKLWDIDAALADATDACVDTLRVDRPYERTDITGMTGISDAQRTALLTLGATSK